MGHLLLVRVGVVEVQKLFSLLSGDKLVGLVRDQSPYYPFITSGSGPPRQARLLNPKKSVITFLVQGLNSGLMLFQLGKMRESVEYKSELDAAKMEELSNRFVPTVQQCEMTAMRTRMAQYKRGFDDDSGSCHTRTGVSATRIGSPSSPGGSPTWWPPSPASSTSSSATPLRSPVPSQDSPTFLATKRPQLHTFVGMRFILTENKEFYKSVSGLICP